jgi:hypothetical protein
MPEDAAERIHTALQVRNPPGESLQPAALPHVRCNDCKREISRAAALNPQTGQSALYFCGSSCFRQWLTTHEWNMVTSRR